MKSLTTLRLVCVFWVGVCGSASANLPNTTELARPGAEPLWAEGPASTLYAMPTPSAIVRRSAYEAEKRRVEYDAEWIAAQPAPEPDPEADCLATALYFEARGESIKGQFAVAEVILNRVAAPEFPKTVCGVVEQGSGAANACQFSFVCDGRPETIAEPEAFAQSAKIARAMLDGAPRPLTRGATYFHGRSVQPAWANHFVRTASIGAHLFYRERIRLASN